MLPYLPHTSHIAYIYIWFIHGKYAYTFIAGLLQSVFSRLSIISRFKHIFVWSDGRCWWPSAEAQLPIKSYRQSQHGTRWRMAITNRSAGWKEIRTRPSEEPLTYEYGVDGVRVIQQRRWHSFPICWCVAAIEKCSYRLFLYGTKVYK